MKEFVISEAQVETAILVGLITQTQDERKTKEYLDELEFLAETAGATVVKRFTQKLPAANSVTYVGKGKLEEIKEYIHQEEENEREVGMVIFDDELSAKQIRNIEAELKVKILDRTSLILDIFAMRAQTANAKTQVELAQYKYMLPRLQRLWTHLERQGGGSGAGGGKGSVGLRGPGETQLEMDRRIILNRMSLLKERLAEIDKQKSTQRKNRGRMIRVALVGYTNVGKSSLLNRLCGAQVLEADMLFATLDPTARRLTLPSGLACVAVDTVGFVSRLPHNLVQAFKSTLEEAAFADVILKVCDASDPEAAAQLAVTDDVLGELGCGDIPQIVVYNKCDRVENAALFDTSAVRTSAVTGEGLDALLARLDAALAGRVRRIAVLLPYDKLGEATPMRENGTVLTEEYRPEGVYLEGIVKTMDLHRFTPYLV